MRTLGGVPRQRGRRALWKFLVATVVMVVVLAACGGGGDSGDKGKLSSLRSDAESAFTTAEVKTIVDDALAIASRNPNTPLGDEAYAFAQDTFLTEVNTSYSGVDTGFFTEGIPEVPGAVSVDDGYLDEFRSMLGFIDAVPAEYRDQAVAQLHDKLVSKANDALRRLETARDSRQQWVTEIQNAGTTSASWVGGLERLPAPLAYLRDIAVQAREKPEFLTGWDAVVAAVAVAQYSPSASSMDYNDNTFTRTYTPSEVAEVAQHVQDLAAAIAAARAFFPAT